MNFSGVCLVTRDVPALAGFYMEVLNATADGNEAHMELTTERAGLAIFSIKGMEEMAPGCMQDCGSGSVTLMFEVKDVDEEFERLKKLKVEMVKRPETYPWGARSFWFRDPDGNIVDFYSNVRK
jgi:uncharacterized glyoxalase superfamily protein PhnB